MHFFLERERALRHHRRSHSLTKEHRLTAAPNWGHSHSHSTRNRQNAPATFHSCTMHPQHCTMHPQHKSTLFVTDNAKSTTWGFCSASESLHASSGLYTQNNQPHTIKACPTNAMKHEIPQQV